MRINKLAQTIKQYSSIIYFVAVLISAHFVWKFTVLGDETDTMVNFIGMDVSRFFNQMSENVAQTTQLILNFFNANIILHQQHVLKYENGVAVRIVWSCTAIKQAFIFICLIIFYKRNLVSKLWFIPVGLVVVYFTNILRITAIVAIIKNNPQWFELLHEHIFKYLFYVVIFGLWIIWEEKIKN